MTKNNFTLTFKLKQHTPLIHFQHDQVGATLRATELKPKLDRFIIERLEGENVVKEKHRDWLIGKGEHLALDYKLNMECSGKKHSYSKSIINADKTCVLFEEIEGTIFSFKTDLLTIIKAHLESFFILHNFGFRTSKGYGSFTISELKLDNVIVATNKEQFSTVLQKQYKIVFFRKVNENICHYVFNDIVFKSKNRNEREIIKRLKQKVKNEFRGSTPFSKLIEVFHNKNVETEIKDMLINNYDNIIQRISKFAKNRV